jgi:hypothetical protein
MQQNRPQQDKNRQADIETGKPQDPRDRRMPGEGGPDDGRSSQQTQQGGSHQNQQGGAGKPTTQQGGSTKEPSKQSTQQGTTGEQYGEGNYTASRHYNEGAKQFAESGKVEQAARDAAPHNEQEAREMRDAEKAGKARMKEEDPEIDRAKPRMPGSGPDE